jgi:hypothetical protein
MHESERYCPNALSLHACRTIRSLRAQGLGVALISINMIDPKTFSERCDE